MRYSERIAAFQTSMIREILGLIQDPEIISFAGGEPAPDLLPLEQYKAASIAALDEYGKAAMSYDKTEGFLPLRQIIVDERLKAAGISNITADNIIITNGSQQGIDFAGRVFLDKGDVVICESPTYLAALNVFNSYMAKTIQVSMDNEGIIMEELEEALKSNPKTKFIYTIPDFQNPSGKSMAAGRRKKIVELAEKYNVVIIEDSPYVDLRYDGERIPSIKSFDTKGLVVYLGSFSKICSPGVRLGYVCAEQGILAQFAKVKQVCDLQPNSMTQRSLTKYMQMYSLDEHINKLIPFYKSRKNAMLEAIQEEFPESVEFTRPEGGIFTWVTVPKGINTVEVFKKATQEEKVAFIPGAPFFIDQSNDNYMRLNFSKTPEDLIREGIKRLGKVLKTYL